MWALTLGFAEISVFELTAGCNDDTVMSMTTSEIKENPMTNRPTPAQDDLVAYVTFHPGCRPVVAAREIGPHGSIRYGYETIKRAIAAGRIINLPDPVRPDWGCLYTI